MPSLTKLYLVMSHFRREEAVAAIGHDYAANRLNLIMVLAWNAPQEQLKMMLDIKRSWAEIWPLKCLKQARACCLSCFIEQTILVMLLGHKYFKIRRKSILAFVQLIEARYSLGRA